MMYRNRADTAAVLYINASPLVFCGTGTIRQQKSVLSFYRIQYMYIRKH